MKYTVHMFLRNTTKGALRFEGHGDDSPHSTDHLVGTLYLRKDGAAKHLGASEGKWPQAVDVTIEVMN